MFTFDWRIFSRHDAGVRVGAMMGVWCTVPLANMCVHEYTPEYRLSREFDRIDLDTLPTTPQLRLRTRNSLPLGY